MKYFHLISLFFGLKYTILCQNTITATYPNTIATNYSVQPFEYNEACNMPSPTLSITLPIGYKYTVTSIEVSYNMTAATGAFQSQQASSIYVINNNIASIDNSEITINTSSR